MESLSPSHNQRPMVLLAFRIQLFSQMSIEEVGAIISTKVLGGIRLIGRENCIRDEIPAIYSETEVLGTRFILSGEPDDIGYELESDNRFVIRGMSGDQIEAALTDVSPLVAKLLERSPGITIKIPK